MEVLGVNGGNGVILFPFKKYLIANVEPRSLFKTPGNVQWKANFGSIPLINESTFDKCWDKYDSLDLNNPDIIVGAPDCGDSSVLSYSRRKKLGNPKENLSLLLFFEFVNRLQPKVFMMENLPKLLETISTSDFDEQFPQYELIYHTQSVGQWGNSQLSRVRLVVVGIRRDIATKELRKGLKTLFRVRSLKYSGVLISNLGDSTGQETEDPGESITLYAGYKDLISNITQEWNTRLVGKKRWTVEGRNFTTAPGVYRNVEFDYPATARKANRQFNHKGLMMSPRELARIQGVPNRFIIYMEKSRLNFWINKGRTTLTKTPPMEISRWFKLQLCKHLKQV
jgi:site-specific DNA-cytosine methylase